MVSILTMPTKRKALYAVRKSYAKLPEILEVPNLIGAQLDSFQRLQEDGLKELLKEIFPIKDFTGNKMELSFVGYEFREPSQSEQECRQRDMTYAVRL